MFICRNAEGVLSFEMLQGYMLIRDVEAEAAEVVLFLRKRKREKSTASAST